MSNTYLWHAYNYKTKEQRSGATRTRRAAEDLAEAAKLDLGFRETNVTVTTPRQHVYRLRPSHAASGKTVWERIQTAG